MRNISVLSLVNVSASICNYFQVVNEEMLLLSPHLSTSRGVFQMLEERIQKITKIKDD